MLSFLLAKPRAFTKKTHCRLTNISGAISDTKTLPSAGAISVFLLLEDKNPYLLLI